MRLSFSCSFGLSVLENLMKFSQLGITYSRKITNRNVIPKVEFMKKKNTIQHLHHQQVGMPMPSSGGSRRRTLNHFRSVPLDRSCPNCVERFASNGTSTIGSSCPGTLCSLLWLRPAQSLRLFVLDCSLPGLASTAWTWSRRWLISCSCIKYKPAERAILLESLSKWHLV